MLEAHCEGSSKVSGTQCKPFKGLEVVSRGKYSTLSDVGSSASGTVLPEGAVGGERVLAKS